MSESIVRMTSAFEGTQITTLTYKGRPAWIAKEIGVALGYEDGGRRLASKINGDWRDDFAEGTDFVVLRGSDLDAFKALSLGTDSVPSRAPQLVLLLEPGVFMACMKTNKPAGRKLRRWLADEVLPQIAHTGAYAATGTDDASPEMRKVVALEVRERRLRRRQDLDEARFVRSTMDDLHKQGLVSERGRAMFLVKAVGKLTGEKVTNLLPDDPNGEFMTPTDIAEALSEKLGRDVTAIRVGKVIKAMGLRDRMPPVHEAIRNKSPHSTKELTTYRYDPAALGEIEAAVLDSFMPPPAPPAAEPETEPDPQEELFKKN